MLHLISMFHSLKKIMKLSKTYNPSPLWPCPSLFSHTLFLTLLLLTMSLFFLSLHVHPHTLCFSCPTFPFLPFFFTFACPPFPSSLCLPWLPYPPIPFSLATCPSFCLPSNPFLSLPTLPSLFSFFVPYLA